jgi:hypothetical protein
MLSVCYFCPILTKICTCRQFTHKLSGIIFAKKTPRLVRVELVPAARHANMMKPVFSFRSCFASTPTSETALFGLDVCYCCRQISTAEALKFGFLCRCFGENSLCASDRGVICKYHDTKTPLLRALKQQ